MNLLEHVVTDIDGARRPLQEFAGRVLLIVNVASQCGFTPQYRGLEQLQQRYGPRGFAVLAFPCDQFGHQEPGSNAQIREFACTSYAATFALFAKIAVNGSAADPLFRHLKTAARGLLGTAAIKWNFTKFLVGRDGQVVARYGPATPPRRLARRIETLLAAPSVHARGAQPHPEA